MKLSHVTCCEAGRRVWVQLLGARTPKILESKNVQNSARFRTTLDLDREYLRNALRFKISTSG